MAAVNVAGIDKIPGFQRTTEKLDASKDYVHAVHEAERERSEPSSWCATQAALRREPCRCSATIRKRKGRDCLKCIV